MYKNVYMFTKREKATITRDHSCTLYKAYPCAFIDNLLRYHMEETLSVEVYQ